jgi:hypothetical protein
MIGNHRPAQRREVTDVHQIAGGSAEVAKPSDLNAHPVTATGRQAIWLQSLGRKFSFLVLDNPSMSNTARSRVFRCARQSPHGLAARLRKTRSFNHLGCCPTRFCAALHNEI